MTYGTMDTMAAKRKSGWGGARQGAGRPNLRTNPYRRSVDFDEADDRVLREIAEQRGVSVAQVIREAVTALLRRQTRRSR